MYLKSLITPINRSLSFISCSSRWPHMFNCHKITSVLWHHKGVTLGTADGLLSQSCRFLWLVRDTEHCYEILARWIERDIGSECFMLQMVKYALDFIAPQISCGVKEAWTQTICRCLHMWLREAKAFFFVLDSNLTKCLFKGTTLQIWSDLWFLHWQKA